MQSEQARFLIRDTLTKPFDKGGFQHFVRNLLNHIDESKSAHWTKPYVKDAFKPRVKWFERLATYTDPNGGKLDILIIHLEKQSSLERARTSLRNFVADYMTTGHGQDKSAVLAAFVSPDESDWRFSFVKLEYEAAADASGKVKVTEALTPARRYSFLVGANEHSHTAQKQFLPLLEQDDTNPSLGDIENAFDIEKVTKEFFQRYKDLFESVRDALNKIVKRNTAVREDFEKKGIETEDFAKKLLGQIVFLYFLQKKGWFAVDRGAQWGSGNKRFLRYVFENRAKLRPRQDRSADRPVNFFNDVLEHLFYDALARERDDDYYARFDCRIPFLNGGLFEPLFGYDWVNTEVLLPDNLFSNTNTTKEGDKGTGILDVFDRYNFTVNEAEPLEKEVAVDPEMLGKVFEGLLPENLRYKVATYYTPRVVVQYMCQQSLISYLSTSLLEIPRDDIERFIRIGYAQADFEAGGTDKHKNKFLDECISRNAKKIDKLLEDIRVCDPAIGSGAFPVGMMQEIVRAREALSVVEDVPVRSAYELKRHAIQNSLYGVDIDPGAVEIAKLRLWLSLVVDEDDRNNIQALPNLDYKIMQGNSILDEFAGVKLLDDDLLDRILVDLEAQIDAISQQINKRDREATRVGLIEGRRSAVVQKLEKEIADLRKQRDVLYRKADEPHAQVTFEDLYSEARQKLNALKRLHRKFFDEASPTRKSTLRREIEQVEWEFMEATLKERGETQALEELARHRRDNRKNYFLWELHFIEVFEKRGGFDVVIANPPYGSDIDDELVVLRKNYASVMQSYSEIYKIFFRRGLDLTGPDGILTFITPNTFIAQPKYKDLRRVLLENDIELIVNLGEEVFEEVVVPVAITVVRQSSSGNGAYWYSDLSRESKFRGDLSTIRLERVETDSIRKRSDLSLFSAADLKANQVSLDDVMVIKDGGLKYQRYGIGLKSKGGSDLYERLISDDPKGFKRTEPIWYGKLIDSYYINNKTDEFFNLNYKDVLRKNETVYFSKQLFDTVPKLIWRQTASRLRATIEDKGRWFRNTIQCAHLRPEFAAKLDIRYVLGVVNSKYLAFLYNRLVNETGRVFPQVKLTHVKKLPLVVAEKKEQSAIAALVDRILAAKCGEPQTDSSKSEEEIDRLVYKLYALTDDEIAIVEEAVK